MEKKSAGRIIIQILFFVLYIAALTYLLFFAEGIGRGESFAHSYNLTPFREIGRYIEYRDQIDGVSFFINIYGNILLFMPMGFMIPSMFKAKKHFPVLVILFCLIFSVGVEYVQFVTGRGCCDVDDVILNTLGGIIGYILYRLYARVRKER